MKVIFLPLSRVQFVILKYQLPRKPHTAVPGSGSKVPALGTIYRNQIISWDRPCLTDRKLNWFASCKGHVVKEFTSL